MKKLRTFVDSGSYSLIELKDRLSHFEPSLDQYNEIELEIYDRDSSKSNEEEADLFETSYFKLLSEIKAILISQSSIENNVSNNSVMQIKAIRLPEVTLPQFNGDYDKWLSFHATFKSLIHENDNISSIEKFHYLKSALKGEASMVLDSLEISSANYEAAWNLLLNRYEDRAFIGQKHMQGLSDFPIITKENYSELRQLLDGLIKHSKALQLLDQNNWDTLVIFLISRKLDASTMRSWNENSSQFINPKLEHFIDFLSEKCKLLNRNHNERQTSNKGNVFNSHKKPLSLVSINKVNHCPICRQSHLIYYCDTFLKLNVKERIKSAKSKGLCLNCLRANHTINNCRYSNCKKCNKQHNSLLHIESVSEQQQSQLPVETTVLISNHNENHFAYTEALLSTAIVHVRDKSGQFQNCRVLLDSGSQTNFITEDCVKRLGLSYKDANIPVTGINESRTNVSAIVNILIQSKFNRFQNYINCLILQSITQNLPTVTIDRSSFQIPENLTLADPEFYKSGGIDILIGVEIFYDLLCVGQIRFNKTHPCLQKTHFGWVVSGNISTKYSYTAITACNATFQNIDNNISKFWDLEHVTENSILTKEESDCESHFIKTFRRNSSGRFTVSLPIKDNVSLGDSKQVAIKRLHSLERKLNKDPCTKLEYFRFLKEYEALGHMSRVTHNNSSESNVCFYLPHHCVIKETSTTTKLRVVFDGSAKSDNGKSLNDILMVGSTIQQDLFSILTRFRTHRIGLISDVEKMYRQVLVDPTQRSLQRILWRENENDEIQSYELNTVTYGTASASFLAIRCLKQIAIDNQKLYTNASKIIQEEFYVDDLVTGVNSVSEALQLHEQLSKILIGGGFPLRKWASNSAEVTRHLHGGAPLNFDFDKNSTCKTLGINWSTTTDEFFYLYQHTIKKRITKRTILSAIAQMFDPLGLLGPVIIIAKIIMQRLWYLNLDWDETIPIDLHTKWQRYQSDLELINILRIPRHICYYSIIEIHGFCDASEKAYGACIYIRCFDGTQNYTSNVICAKSRVAPLKAISLPRLELCGALLLSKLMNKTISILNVHPTNIFYWSDSTICLAWIKSNSKSWKTFVSNRIGEIEQITEINNWYHVSSEDNPADILSRGISTKDFLNSSLWWEGPAWLSKDVSYWPVQPQVISNSELPEYKAISFLATTLEPEWDIHGKFSNFTRLIRVSAYCMRFASNSRNISKQTGHLTKLELDTANFSLIKYIQNRIFKSEYHKLALGYPINSRSSILSLNPFLDSTGIIRVGGRLRNAIIPYSQKHPCLLPSNHIFSNLLIKHEHIKNLHSGVNSTLSSIRSKYWIINGRNAVKKVIRKCIKCFRARPQLLQPLMADLPLHRVQQSRPFINSGVDFGGPLYIKQGFRKSKQLVKIYFAVFVCFATKAIHIELVEDLTAESFLASLKRFMARRGKIANIYSDNATNFTGGLRELLNLLKQSNNNKLTSSLSEDGINWHFIPPRSPHFGGLWEAAIKSVKQHLNRVLQNSNLTLIELYTLLVQIEAILNSRPLSALSSDPNDQNYLTPAHFIIGDLLTTNPEPDITHLKINTLSRWQRVEQIRQHFWCRWHKEYLNNLQQRSKWRVTSGYHIEIGQLVVVKEDNVSPMKWMLGRIQEVHPGSDGVVRAVTIMTKSGAIKRATVRIAILPLDES